MTDPSFKDHFSGHAADYARHRPRYPEVLFDWLAGQAPARGLAWDVGTGNGQVARGLARHFERVYATDASAAQLDAAENIDGVHFALEPAENCALGDGQVQLVTVGQALHWFDLPRFYAEVNRVLAPGGVLAAFTYQLCRVSRPIDRAVSHLYQNVVGRWWPPERRHVDLAYRDLPFPFEELRCPGLELVSRLSLAQYVDYLGTWSAVQRYRLEHDQNPLSLVGPQLAEAWGDPARKRAIRWPLVIRAGRALPAG